MLQWEVYVELHSMYEDCRQQKRMLKALKVGRAVLKLLTAYQIKHTHSPAVDPASQPQPNILRLLSILLNMMPSGDKAECSSEKEKCCNLVETTVNQMILFQRKKLQDFCIDSPALSLLSGLVLTIKYGPNFRQTEHFSHFVFTFLPIQRIMK